MIVKLAAIFFSMILVNNYVLMKFYGICPFLGVSKKLDSALGMSGAVILTVMRIVFGLGCIIHCEASTISTSLVPMPNATAPSAPWVEVWLSPHTMVCPGRVRPDSGPITCMIPLRGSHSP